MISVTIDIIHPLIQTKKHDIRDGRTCLFTEIITGEGNRIGLHFENKDELRAFIGSLMISAGFKNANPQ